MKYYCIQHLNLEEERETEIEVIAKTLMKELEKQRNGLNQIMELNKRRIIFTQAKNQLEDKL